jgi:hypothetical protein
MKLAREFTSLADTFESWRSAGDPGQNLRHQALMRLLDLRARAREILDHDDDRRKRDGERGRNPNR